MTCKGCIHSGVCYKKNDYANFPDRCGSFVPERPQGEWIKWNFKTFGPMGDWEYKCSNCEKVYGGEYNFCPNCGSKMKLPDSEV